MRVSLRMRNFPLENFVNSNCSIFFYWPPRSMWIIVWFCIHDLYHLSIFYWRFYPILFQHCPLFVHRCDGAGRSICESALKTESFLTYKQIVLFIYLYSFTYLLHPCSAAQYAVSKCKGERKKKCPGRSEALSPHSSPHCRPCPLMSPFTSPFCLFIDIPHTTSTYLLLYISSCTTTIPWWPFLCFGRLNYYFGHFHHP